MKIDENDKTKVILTNAGAEVINHYNTFLNRYCENNNINFKTDYIENDEFIAELHTIMTVFYGSISNHGTEKMFKEIEILK